MKLIDNRKNALKKRLLIAAIVLCIGLGSYGVLAYTQSFWPFNVKTKTDSPTENTESINYDSPTQQEVNEGQDAKKRLLNEDSSSSGSTVSVGVAYSEVTDGKLEIRAFVPSVIEGNGKCTATLQKGSATVSESSDAFIDSTSSQCQPIYISTSAFQPKGTWSLVVSYKSPTSTGKSEAIEVTI